ncbi:hypothetical protein HZC34_00615 [Candidatus Saganbacteria bacterium]|nr:hypothetical protein [Candidatus Saganbacteria bacterium]
MTKVKIKDIYKFILKVFPSTPNGDLLVDVENGNKIILSSPNKGGIVSKTSGILKIKTNGIQFENKLRRSAKKRLKREVSK